MRRAYLLTIIFAIMLLAPGCSKKHHPGKTPTGATEKNEAGTAVNNDSLATKKVVRIKTVTPKVITVNDNAAHKSIDGRLYYDLEGKRYWKNYKDGKYYLFDKSMYTNEAFKPR